jgi:hypothetical protein
MENLGVVDQMFFKADQHHVVSAVMGGASVLEPAQPGERYRRQFHTLAG